MYHFPMNCYCKHKDKKQIAECKEMVKNPPETIAQFRNIYKGECCFIVCNGPSLTAADLDCIAKEWLKENYTD